jgi:HAD superfamily hydrolase (TIGR01509 family)
MRALVFDFDGLILDTEMPAWETWSAIFREHGATLPLDLWATRIGNPNAPFNTLAHLEEQLGHPVDREALRRDYRRRCDLLIAQKPVLPGVHDRIAEAQALDVRLAVASSSPRSWVQGHLERLGMMHNFDALSCGDEVPKTKPEPFVYQAALAKLNVPPPDAVALEDSPNGVTAAKRAGMFCVAVPNALTQGLPLDHADIRVKSLTELKLAGLQLK